jgi:histidyl-tRNA synthetase
LIDAIKLSREDILRNSLNDDFDLFTEYRVQFPREVETADELSPTMFRDNGLADRVRYFSHIEQGIIGPLRAVNPNVRFCLDFSRKAGLGYYPHLCFHIFASNRKGDVVQIADGGAVDWAAKLLGNNREAMVTSGIGSELMQKLF